MLVAFGEQDCVRGSGSGPPEVRPAVARGPARPIDGILGVEMQTAACAPIVTPDDPRLANQGREDVAGADQIPSLLAASPDERLDSLVAMLEFVAEAREALSRTR